MQCAFSLASMDFKTMQNYCSFVEIESTSFLVSMGSSAYSLKKDIYDTENNLKFMHACFALNSKSYHRFSLHDPDLRVPIKVGQ